MFTLFWQMSARMLVAKDKLLPVVAPSETNQSEFPKENLEVQKETLPAKPLKLTPSSAPDVEDPWKALMRNQLTDSSKPLREISLEPDGQSEKGEQS